MSRRAAAKDSDPKFVRDCGIGDVVRFADGSVAVVTATIAGAPFGRFVDERGERGEIVELDPPRTVVRLGLARDLPRMIEEGSLWAA